MKIYQITDTHLAEDSNELDTNLIRLLDIVNQDMDEKVLLLTGDLANAAVPTAYQRIRTYLEACESITHCYALAGNHDDLNVMKACFKGSKIKIRKSAIVNGLPFHFLDTSQKPLGSDMELGAGRVTNREIAALRKAIRKTPKLIVSHHPLLDVSGQWFKQIGIENQADVVRCFNHKRTVISGHAHHYFDIKQGNVRQLVGIASAYGFEHQSNTPQRNDCLGMSIYKAIWSQGAICVEHLNNHLI
ncbi:metallophosphoesterase family protein [Photobacterium rosenbergii]|uniref:metallophosphoesterase family protein n=1 Tax=Photobacterium rosenbergii TaxID=294936 RepID=UPI001C991959|nr:metallophosphoesterase [Photobacterium rosenbergii]MBY5948873.1 metallophosphoesterase [Photobacterium rosenbergii]